MLYCKQKTWEGLFMKHFSRTIIAIILAVVMATLIPAQVFADTPDYISEIKIATGSTDSLKGYTILSDTNNKPIDLNQKSGGDTASKGEKAVYLGYKTTKDEKEAITDLALMNMKGGYSVAEYEALMETQMKAQIIPFVENFIPAIKEYRENYNSKNKRIQQRAHYIHDILNKLVDDDTEKHLGDLLLNETKFEMGDEAYDALPDEEKKNHADILTIIAQANGKATLLIKNLLTRASDTEENTWIDRFTSTTYEDLIEQTGLPPKDARKALAKDYDDDANTVLYMWDTFREQLLGTDEAAAELENAEAIDTNETIEKIENINENSDIDEYIDVAESIVKQQAQTAEVANNIADIAVATYLKTIEYDDGTLYDFFTKTYEEIEDDITVLYPLAAALSDGQRAGLDFISLRELVMICDQSKDYDDEELDKLEETSIYEGVDRGIYQKGGVALTSDALRSDALLSDSFTDTSTLNTLTNIFIYISIGSAAGLVATLSVKGVTALIDKVGRANFDAAKRASEQTAKTLAENATKAWKDYMDLIKVQRVTPGTPRALAQTRIYTNAQKAAEEYKAVEGVYKPVNINNTAVKAFSIGFAVATVVFSAVSVYLSYQSMKNSYKVEVTPIPHYMIDEKDLVSYNHKGEKIILKNQSAYYKAVECDRKESDEYYNMLGTCADLNGDVGSQWLALYAAKNEVETPILADSLTVVIGSEKVPAEYSTGIHMFGSEAAFNLNSPLYNWNSDAPSVQVYFKRDESTKPNSAGSVFTKGTIAVAGIAGILIGSAATILAANAKRKKATDAKAD